MRWQWRATVRWDYNSNFPNPRVFSVGAALSANTQQQSASMWSCDSLPATRCCDKCSVLPKQILQEQGSVSRGEGDTLHPLLHPCGSSKHLSAQLHFLPQPLSLHGTWICLSLAAAISSLILPGSLHGRRCSCMLLPAHPEPLLPFMPPSWRGFTQDPVMFPPHPLCRLRLQTSLTPLQLWESLEINLMGPKPWWSWPQLLSICFPEPIQKKMTPETNQKTQNLVNLT